jgi:hypothetical protein
MLADILGFRGAHVLGGFLEPIMRYCQKASIPSLAVLVVSQNTGLPGSGLDVPRGGLHSEQERVFKFDWYGIHPPTPNEFDLAMKD